MLLCLDVGNSQIFGGVFSDTELLLRFRHETHRTSTSDQLGVFLRQVLKENGIEASKIKHIGISSVVPSLDYSLGSACIKYFDIDPFWLTADVFTGLKIDTHNPRQVGADLISTAIAGVAAYPKQNMIIVDFGTVTTFVPVSKDKEFLGAVFQLGVRSSMKALQSSTDQLPSVQIVKPKNFLGKDTVGAIQSGLYYGQVGAAKEIMAGIAGEAFGKSAYIKIGTGGFSQLMEEAKVVDVILPDLILEGIRIATLAPENQRTAEAPKRRRKK
jgi:type III pantothenate kinase